MCWNWGQQKTWGVSIPPHGSVRNVKSCRNICLFTSGLSQFSPSPPCQSNVGFLIRNRPSKQPTRPTVLGRFLPIALQHNRSARRIGRKGSKWQDPTHFRHPRLNVGNVRLLVRRLHSFFSFFLAPTVVSAPTGRSYKRSRRLEPPDGSCGIWVLDQPARHLWDWFAECRPG